MNVTLIKSSMIVPFAIGLLFATALCAQTQERRDEVDIHAPYVATPYVVVDAMLALARVNQADLLIDLGCGDGRIAIEAAKRYGARAIGVDIDPQRIAEAKENAKREGVENLVRFEEQNVFDTDLTRATVVTLYLLQNINIRLSPVLKRQLKPGARIVSHSFDMGIWKPAKTQIIAGDRIFLWTIGQSSGDSNLHREGSE